MRIIDEYPRHAHRTPSEIAEDEAAHFLTEGRCGVSITVPQKDATLQQVGIPRRLALLTWADAHPLKQR